MDLMESVDNASNASCLDELPYTEVQILFRTSALLPLTVLGLATNLFNVLIFTQPAMRVSLVNWFLLGLALSDSVLLTSTVFMLGFPVLAETGGDFPAIQAAQYITRWFYPVGLFAQTCSVYLIVMASAFRYLGVCRPFLAQRVGTRSNVGSALSLTVFFAFLFTMPRWAELRTRDCWSRKFGREFVAVDQTDLSHDGIYHLVYKVFAYTLVMFLIPFATLITLNSFIVNTLRKSRRLRRSMMDATQNWIKHTGDLRNDNGGHRKKPEKSHQQKSESKENNITFMLLAIVSIFLICNLLPLINNVLDILKGPMGLFENVNSFGDSFTICVEVANLLVALNSSLYIVIYLVFNEKYRLVSKYLIGMDRRETNLLSRTPTVRIPSKRPTTTNRPSSSQHTEAIALLSANPSLQADQPT